MTTEHNEQQALADAAKSLRTIADLAGGNEYLMTVDDVRAYANSRASVAEAALAAQPAEGYTAADMADQGASQFHAGHAAAQAEQPTAAQEWQTMETAPLDENVLMVWRPVDAEKRPWHVEVVIAQLSSYEAGSIWLAGRYQPASHVSHWMPLPDPPLAARPQGVNHGS